MADERKQRKPEDGELSADEVDQQEAAELPDREAMSLIDANVAAPVNAAVAANVLSDDSTAFANAEQTATIDQTTG
jgi:hypothetical protein